jgi:hypothetical protein
MDGYKDESGDTIRGVGLARDRVERIERFLGIKAEARRDVLAQLRELFASLESAPAQIHLYALGYGDDRAALDLSIARGLAYYTVVTVKNMAVGRAKAAALTARDEWLAARPGQTIPRGELGFGEFKDKPIAPGDLEQLQRNLLLSHSVGAGDEVFSAEVVRAVLATRLNAFLKGHSGVRRTMVDVIEAMLNRGVIPLVPVQGSVGASGDLCPLSHTFATLAVGRFYTTSDPTIRDAAELPALLGFDAETIKPTFKEGLARGCASSSTATISDLPARARRRPPGRRAHLWNA